MFRRCIFFLWFVFTKVSPFVQLVCKNSNCDDLQVQPPVQDMERPLCTVCSAAANLSVTKTN